MSDQTRLADFLPYLLSFTSNAVSDRIADEYPKGTPKKSGAASQGAKDLRDLFGDGD